MVPIYAVSSFISLVSLEAAVVIDAVRDIYEVSVPLFDYQLVRSCVVRHLSYIASLCCFYYIWAASDHCSSYSTAAPPRSPYSPPVSFSAKLTSATPTLSFSSNVASFVRSMFALQERWLIFVRVCPGQACTCSGDRRPEGGWQIQRRQLPRGFGLPVCQHRLQCKHLPCAVLVSNLFTHCPLTFA